jgi:hypothetical protein
MSTYNDGNIPYGVSVATFTAGRVYVCEDFSIDKSSTVIERRNGSGVMTGRVVIDENNVTGSATLQRATSTSPMPEIGATFTPPSDAAYTGQAYVTGSSAAQSQTTAHTFTIRWAAVINA